ncbi:hypothetical protein BM1_10394 [Bipolaris maydis]|nr:hypothetical protein BM1_10394 [Bipolaris maydis]
MANIVASASDVAMDGNINSNGSGSGNADMISIAIPVHPPTLGSVSLGNWQPASAGTFRWRAVLSPWPRSDGRHVKRSLFALAGGLLEPTQIRASPASPASSNKYRSSAPNSVASVYVKVVTINSNGRQSASFIRVAAALGWQVRAQMRDLNGIVARELSELDNVTVFIGALEDKKFLDDLFKSAQCAFINTTHWGDEVAIGRALADAAKKAGIQHYIYSSMPDHSVFGQGWKALPMWAPKFTVEQYVRQIGLPATFVYCGAYHNNFTGLDFPLFRMEHQYDGSFVWQAPFHPDQPLPWLDSEHDVGPAIFQLFKEGPRKWNGKRIPLAFASMTPRQVCKAFSVGLKRPVRYKRGPIMINVPTPAGYREHLAALEYTLGEKGAPYFGPDLEPDVPAVALSLWEGNRSMEEYAQEVFPVEEAANGLTWMEEVETPRREIEIDFEQINC